MTQQEFDQQVLSRLNPQQQEAVRTVDGAVLLLAVPGSGKTTVLVTRLGYMVYCKNIAPENILTMTYTVSATQEMHQRLCALFGSQLADSMEICTINSLSAQIIRIYAGSHGKREPFPLIENEDAARLVGEIYQQIYGEFPTESTIKDIRTGITYIKNRMLSPEEIQKIDIGIAQMPKIYRQYCDRLKQAQLMDFDDQMGYALTILKSYPSILNHFQERYRYICVDEAQDTSKIQHEIIRLLAEKYQNLFMVGDEDQSIYGFRAAYPQALLDFRQDHPNAKVLLMEQNYRSAKQIVSAANRFVAKNRFRYEKNMIPTRPNGQGIQKISVSSRTAQYKYLFALAGSCQQETAVLYRNNDSALPLIDLFERNGIAYNCKKFEDAFFTHRIIVDLTDIIRFSYDPYDADRFMRIYYKFGAPITKSCALYACAQSIRSGRSILDELVGAPELHDLGLEAAQDLQALLPQLNNQSADAAVCQIFNTLRYRSYAEQNKLDLGKLDILRMLAKQEPTPMRLLERLSELRMLIQNHVNRSENMLTLSTVHSSKGLEYERVYLLDVLDGILPRKALGELSSGEDTQQYEEDRRIYYVAMTRAKNELFLFDCPDRKSQFTDEILPFLPRDRMEPDDIFAPFSHNLCGKSYRHKVYGKGKIIAHHGMTLLVEFSREHMQLMTLSRMLDDRDTSPAGDAPITAPGVSAEEAAYYSSDIRIGSRVSHKTFGPGVILSIVGGVADIRFEQDHTVRRIMLEVSFRNGILK